MAHPLEEVVIEDKERLRRLAPALRRAGLVVEFARDMRARTTRLEDARGTASSPSWSGPATGAHDADDADDAPRRPSSGQGAHAHAEPEPGTVL